jgi:hypothetical protein
MRSSAARLTLGVAAWIALGAAAAFIVQFEQQLSRRREAVRLFDVRAGDAAVALADVRNAQQAYLVPGQGLSIWMSRLDAFLKNANASLDELRHAAADPDSRQALTDAGASLASLRSIDQRAREYLDSAQPLMAADVIFSEGLEMAAKTGRQLETSRIAEHIARDRSEMSIRLLQAYGAGGAAVLSALVIAVLVMVTPAKRSSPRQLTRPDVMAIDPPSDGLLLDGLELGNAPLRVPRPAHSQSANDLPHESLSILQAAVAVCTELNRARDFDDLNTLLSGAAKVIDASGLIVWVGSAAGASLRPVLAHGYSDQALTRMPLVARSEDNAAAAAYRTGELQIVRTRPGVSSGALAAPLLSRDGCIGALTAEIRNGGESAPDVQAMAGILAAQLAGILADSVPADGGIEEPKIASA